MTIEQRTVGRVLVLSVRGDVTMRDGSAMRLSDKVRSALVEGYDQLLLDLGGVRYMDSAGLGDLVQAHAAVRRRGGQVRVLNAGTRARDLLVVTRLLTVFDCFDQEADALASFRENAVSR